MTVVPKLNARGHGEYSYNERHDLLLFKIKDRAYSKSIEFDELVMDIDEQGFVTGVRILDASTFFNLPKSTLLQISAFEFKTKVEKNLIRIQLHFDALSGDKMIIHQGQDIVRESTNSGMKDSEVICTVA